MSIAGVKYSDLLKSTVKLGIFAWQTHHNNVLWFDYTPFRFISGQIIHFRHVISFSDCSWGHFGRVKTLHLIIAFYGFIRIFHLFYIDLKSWNRNLKTENEIIMIFHKKWAYYDVIVKMMPRIIVWEVASEHFFSLELEGGFVCLAYGHLRVRRKRGR